MSKRCVFKCFLKVATEMVEWTYTGRLFQRDGGYKSEILLVMTLGTDRLIPLFGLSEQDGSDGASME